MKRLLIIVCCLLPFLSGVIEATRFARVVKTTSQTKIAVQAAAPAAQRRARFFKKRPRSLNLSHPKSSHQVSRSKSNYLSKGLEKASLSDLEQVRKPRFFQKRDRRLSSSQVTPQRSPSRSPMPQRSPSPPPSNHQETIKPLSNQSSFEDVADYVSGQSKLPDHYITKAEAKALGWNPKKGNLADVAPGKSIGGDVFKNREGKLPQAPGRTWYEADIGYSSGSRGANRVLYSSDGLVYKTSDHYQTFTLLKGSP